MTKDLMINAGITLVVVVAGVVIAQKWVVPINVENEKVTVSNKRATS